MKSSPVITRHDAYMAPSKKLEKHAPLLLCMSKNPTLRRQLITSSIAKELLQCIQECVFNVLKGHVHLDTEEKKRLAHHKNNLRAFVRPKTPISKKKEIVQKGGFLPALLGPLLGSVILPLAQKIFT